MCTARALLRLLSGGYPSESLFGSVRVKFKTSLLEDRSFLFIFTTYATFCSVFIVQVGFGSTLKCITVKGFILEKNYFKLNDCYKKSSQSSLL